MKIEVVCFDIDGTLYPNRLTKIHLIHSLFPSPLLAIRYQLFRKQLRKDSDEKTEPENQQGFKLRQAKWMAKAIGQKDDSPRIQRMAQRIENQFYRTWAHNFSHLVPYAGLREALMEIREQGIRISILSDFPVERKLETLGIADLVDFSCCSEESGYLKPHPAPFLYVARHMNVPCDRILFAGDSYEKDVLGASNVGMKTALFSERAHSPSVRRHMQKTYSKADLIYADYHELPQCMIKLLEEEDA